MNDIRTPDEFAAAISSAANTIQETLAEETVGVLVPACLLVIEACANSVRDQEAPMDNVSLLKVVRKSVDEMLERAKLPDQTVVMRLEQLVPGNGITH